MNTQDPAITIHNEWATKKCIYNILDLFESPDYERNDIGIIGEVDEIRIWYVYMFGSWMIDIEINWLGFVFIGQTQHWLAFKWYLIEPFCRKVYWGIHGATGLLNLSFMVTVQRETGAGPEGINPQMCVCV